MKVLNLSASYKDIQCRGPLFAIAVSMSEVEPDALYVLRAVCGCNEHLKLGSVARTRRLTSFLLQTLYREFHAVHIQRLR